MDHQTTSRYLLDIDKVIDFSIDIKIKPIYHHRYMGF
jgi:hypothetical protein